jgi:methylmalonyl-CoA carboxyltransferase large subunit
MFITGPQVIKQVTGEEITAEALGGPDAHMQHSGVIHFVAENDQEALYLCRRLLSFLPSNNMEDPPRVAFENNVDPNPELTRIIPADPKQGFDVRDVIVGVVDRGDFLEVQAGYARNIVIGFARMLGRSIGIIANQPSVLSGVLDINAATKSSRFIRFCNAFNIPLVTFVDVPGFLPGVEQEHGGIIRHGAKMLFAYSAATVPKIQVILRKSFGGAHLAMCSKDLGADRVSRLAYRRSRRHGGRGSRRSGLPQGGPGGFRQGRPQGRTYRAVSGHLLLALRGRRPPAGR